MDPIHSLLRITVLIKVKRRHFLMLHIILILIIQMNIIAPLVRIVVVLRRQLVIRDVLHVKALGVPVIVQYCRKGVELMLLHGVARLHSVLRIACQLRRWHHLDWTQQL